MCSSDLARHVRGRVPRQRAVGNRRRHQGRAAALRLGDRCVASTPSSASPVVVGVAGGQRRLLGASSHSPEGEVVDGDRTRRRNDHHRGRRAAVARCRPTLTPGPSTPASRSRGRRSDRQGPHDGTSGRESTSRRLAPAHRRRRGHRRLGHQRGHGDAVRHHQRTPSATLPGGLHDPQGRCKRICSRSAPASAPPSVRSAGPRRSCPGSPARRCTPADVGRARTSGGNRGELSIRGTP